MKFVGRIKGTERLKNALSREKYSLVVIYGHRRMGKSTLIKRVQSENVVYFLANLSEGTHQRSLLAKVVAEKFPDFDKVEYPDWESIFRSLNYPDPFMAFYYRFVVPNRSFIELDRRLPIEHALNSHFSEYVSMQWESLCRDSVTGNVINGVLYGEARRWWGAVINEGNEPEQVEFDVMAESIDKKYLSVGECKWTNHGSK